MDNANAELNDCGIKIFKKGLNSKTLVTLVHISSL
jgi:hypothetical protein